MSVRTEDCSSEILFPGHDFVNGELLVGQFVYQFKNCGNVLGPGVSNNHPGYGSR